jgi:hypothetical protein
MLLIRALTASLLLVFLSNAVAAASPDALRPQTASEKIKKEIVKTGTGEKARISVKLFNDTSYTGYIRDAANDEFTLVLITGSPVTIKYSDVRKVGGVSWFERHKLAIGVTIGVVATAAAIVLIFNASGKRL